MALVPNGGTEQWRRIRNAAVASALAESGRLLTPLARQAAANYLNSWWNTPVQAPPPPPVVQPVVVRSMPRRDQLTGRKRKRGLAYEGTMVVSKPKKRYAYSGYVSRAPNGIQELQIHDASDQVTLISTTAATMWIQPDIAVNSNFDGRKGRCVYPNSIQLRLGIYYPNSPTLTSSHRPRPVWEWYIYQDMQVNGGALPSFSTIRDVPHQQILSETNLNNLARFKLIKSGVFRPGGTAFINVGATGTVYDMPALMKNVYTKKVQPITYQTGSSSGSAYTELESGGLILAVRMAGYLAEWTSIVNPVISWSCRMTYTS